MANKYVNKSGDNGNGGTSHSDAYETISYGISQMSNGDTLYVGSGVYEENLSFSSSGTYNIYGDGYVVLDGSSVGGTCINVAHHVDATVKLYDLTIVNYTNGAWAGHRNEIHFKRCIVKDCSGYGLRVTNYQSSGYTLSEDCVWDNAHIDCLREYLPGNVYIKTSTFINNTSANGAIYAYGLRSGQSGKLYISSCHIDDTLKLNGNVYGGGYVELGSLDYCNVRDSIEYQGSVYNNLSEFQAAYEALAGHSFNKDPDFNDNYTLRWSSPNIGNGESSVDIGGLESASYYNGSSNLFEDAILSNISRNASGDFEVSGASVGTITSSVLDFGSDVEIGIVRLNAIEYYPDDVVDYDNGDTEPNRRNYEYRYATDASGAFTQSAGSPSWNIAEFGDHLKDDKSVPACRYIQFRITIRTNGVAA